MSIIFSRSPTHHCLQGVTNFKEYNIGKHNDQKKQKTTSQTLNHKRGFNKRFALFRKRLKCRICGCDHDLLSVIVNMFLYF